MYSLNKKILHLENKIRTLESKIKDLTKNVENKKITPHTQSASTKRAGWFFIGGKWCTYAIYAD